MAGSSPASFSPRAKGRRHAETAFSGGAHNAAAASHAAKGGGVRRVDRASVLAVSRLVDAHSVGACVRSSALLAVRHGRGGGNFLARFLCQLRTAARLCAAPARGCAVLVCAT